MASSPSTSRQTDGETMETMRDFIFGASKSWQMVTAAMKWKNTCSWKKNYDKARQHIKKQRHYFANKGQITLLVKAMVFPVVMYGCESWTTKKAECQRIDAFELWCWRGLLRVPWTARRYNQSILKEISPDTEAPILWPPDVKTWLLGKDPEAGKDWRREEKGTTENEMVEWHHRLKGHEFE